MLVVDTEVLHFLQCVVQVAGNSSFWCKVISSSVTLEFTFTMPRFHYCVWIWFDCVVFTQFSRLGILEWDSVNRPRNSMIRKFVTVPCVRKKALFLVWQWIWWTRVWIWACKLVLASELIQFAMCKLQLSTNSACHSWSSL